MLCPPHFSPDATPDCFAIRPKKILEVATNSFQMRLRPFNMAVPLASGTV